MTGTERSRTGMRGHTGVRGSGTEVVCVCGSAKHQVKVGSSDNQLVFNTDSKSAVQNAISGLALE